MVFVPIDILPSKNIGVYIVIKTYNIDGLPIIDIEGVYENYYEAQEASKSKNYFVKGPFKIKKMFDFKITNICSPPFFRNRQLKPLKYLEPIIDDDDIKDEEDEEDDKDDEDNYLFDFIGKK